MFIEHPLVDESFFQMESDRGNNCLFCWKWDELSKLQRRLYAKGWEEEFIEPFRPGSNVPLDPFMNHIPATGSIAFLAEKKRRKKQIASIGLFSPSTNTFHLSFSFFFFSINFSAQNTVQCQLSNRYEIPVNTKYCEEHNRTNNDLWFFCGSFFAAKYSNEFVDFVRNSWTSEFPRSYLKRYEILKFSDPILSKIGKYPNKYS